MLAHAGTEAVRLVPFSSLLLSVTLTLSSDYRSLAWRLPLCQDAVRIMISWRHFVRYREESATMRRSRVLSERSVHARSARSTREELAVFGVAHGASEAARLSAAEWRAVRARLCMPSACKSRGVQHTSLGCDGTRHSPLPGPFCMAHAVGEAVRLVPLSASRLSFRPLCAWR